MELVPPHAALDTAFPDATCTMRLKNGTKQIRAFAIRTTNLLGTFTFQPSRGMLPAGTSIDFVVAIDERKRQELVDNREFRCRDEFVVVSCAVTEEDFEDYERNRDDIYEMRFILDKHLGATFKMDKLLFPTVFVPPAKQSEMKRIRNILNEETSAREKVRANCFATCGSWLKLGRLRGQLVLDRSELTFSLDNHRNYMTVFNRTDFFVFFQILVSEASAPNSIFEIESCYKVLEPKSSSKIWFSRSSTKKGGNTSTTSELSTASDGLAMIYEIRAGNILNPAILDEALTLQKKGHGIEDSLAKEYWRDHMVNPRKRVWSGEIPVSLEDGDVNKPRLFRYFHHVLYYGDVHPKQLSQEAKEFVLPTEIREMTEGSSPRANLRSENNAGQHQGRNKQEIPANSLGSDDEENLHVAVV